MKNLTDQSPTTHQNKSDCGGLCDVIADDSSKTIERRGLTKAGKVILGISGTIFVGFNIVAAPFVAPGLRKICLPFVPATPAQVRNVLTALRGRKGTLLDIGSGDGRIVIETAKEGFKSTGVELNPWLVLYSKWNARRSNVHTTTNFVTKDLWKTNLGSYDNVVVFGVESMMERLELKFKDEVKEDARIVACRFPLPTWEPVETIGSGIDTVWLYRTDTIPSSQEQNDN